MSEGKKTRSHAEVKQQRLADALRENLKRRKAQSRAQSRSLTPIIEEKAPDNSRKTEKN